MRKSILIGLLLLFATGAWAQAPQITSYMTGVPGDTLYGPGTTLIILGTFTFHSAGRDYTITVGGQTTGINVAFNGAFILATIPPNAAPGADSLVITYQGQASNALPITVVPLAPEFESENISANADANAPPIVVYDPFLHQSNVGQPISAASPASLGEVVQAQITGLGSNVAPAVVPTVKVAGANAQVLQVNNSTVDSASETVFFAVPQSAPTGNDLVVATVAGVASLPQVLQVGSQTSLPTILANGTVDAASLIPGNPPPPLAPGSIATLFGSNLTNGASCVPPCEPTLDASGKLNTTLVGTSVSVDGVLAPMFFATPGQLGFQVPLETPAGSATIQVSVGGAGGPLSNFNVAAVSPGIFTTAASGSGQGAILNGTEIGQGISSLVAPVGSFPNAHPAKVGDVIVIYCTGLGAVSPPIATGVLPSGQMTPTTPLVTIGGLNATVQFSGLTPGDAGLYQINAVVPPAAQTGNSVPVVVTINGQSSNTATIALQ